MGALPSQKEAQLYRRKTCRYCDSRLQKPFLDLGTMALANSFLTREQLKEEEFICPLSLVWCRVCGLVQLTHVVPPELMFSNYLYVSSTTETFRKHFADYAKRVREIARQKGKTNLAVDIGSNDGLFLSCYQREGFQAVGIEPACNLSQEANQKGLTTYNDYFGEGVVQKILRDFGPAIVISANNVFAHIDDIHEVCKNVLHLLHPEGIFVLEFPYLVTMVKELLFDMIYHEHLSYIAVRPLSRLLSQFDLELFAIDQVATHGGSLRTFIRRKNGKGPPSREVSNFLSVEEEKGYNTIFVYQEFAKRIYHVREELIRFVREIKSEGKSLSGYGAPAKGNTLINFCGFNASQIDYIVDDNPLKQNLFTPGSRIPVVPIQHLFKNPTDYIILFAWNFSEEIIKKLHPLKQKGVNFILPLPQPKIL